MKKIVTVGSATQDIFVTQDTPYMMYDTHNAVDRTYLALPEGEKIEVKSLDYHIGGGATNSAVSFSRLNNEVDCCIRIGDDQQGEYIQQQLEQQNITVHATIDPQQATGISFILPTASKDRVVLVWRGANAFFEQSNVPDYVFKNKEGIYLSSLTGHSAHAFLPLVQRAKKEGMMVATNPGTSQLKKSTSSIIQSLAYIDILICNAYEAQLCMRSLAEAKHKELTFFDQNHADWPSLLQPAYGYNVRFFCNLLFQNGLSVVMITNGQEGVYVATRDGLLFHPSLPTTIVNTLGAGDAFGSCFVSSLMQAKDIKTATIEALLNARSVIEQLDAKSGLLTQQQLAEKYRVLMQEYNGQFMLFDL